jgi:4-hydroxybenzoate polyprenyltransferase
LVKQFFGFIFFGSIFISLCAVALCIETNLLLHLPLDGFLFYSFIFGATLLQYNLHYLFKKTAVKASYRLAWSQRNKITHRLLILTAAVFVIAGLYSFRLHQFIFLFLAGFVAFVYSVPVLPFKSKKRIKDFGVVKIVTLVAIWTLVTVYLPAQEKVYSETLFISTFVARFIFIFILCLMFDIRDVDIDSKENIKTIPLIAGRQKTRRIIYFLLVIFVLVSLLQYFQNNNFIQFNGMLISAFATFFVVKISNREHADFFYLACVDGMMLLQAMLVIIGSN